MAIFLVKLASFAQGQILPQTQDNIHIVQVLGHIRQSAPDQDPSGSALGG
jgi:hypothetical protein